MQKLLKKSPVFLSALLGFIFLIPLIALELINRWKFNESFPIAVFTFTWVLQTLFIFILMRFVKDYHYIKSSKKNPAFMAIRLLGLLLIAYIWGSWIMDQWPCLMGLPNCD